MRVSARLLEILNHYNRDLYYLERTCEGEYDLVMVDNLAKEYLEYLERGKVGEKAALEESGVK